MATVAEIAAYLEEKAPSQTAEEWDNPGLLVGDGDRRVEKAMVALDITPGAVEAAARWGAQLLVSHHPVIFHPLRRLGGGDAPYLLASHGIAALCLHTNLDKAAGGVNDTLAARLGLTQVRPAADGLCRIGRLEEELPPRLFAARVAERLGAPVRLAAGAGRPVRSVAVCGGAGCGELLALLADPDRMPDAAVTGEVKHHEWLQAAALGAVLVDAGHYYTEVPVVETLLRWLSTRFPETMWAPYHGGEGAWIVAGV